VKKNGLELEWVPLYLNDILKDADWLGMTARERGWYMTMLLKQPDLERQNRGFADDMIVISSMAENAMPDDPEWEAFIGKYLDRKFPKGRDGMRRNPKMHEVYWQQVAKIEAKKEKGRLGAQVRWAKVDR
jgi:hypothetical protein